jgi:hypothetical protein
MSAPTETTSYQVKLDFPDARSREDFDVAFRGWLKEYQQRATIHRAMVVAEQAAEGDDTGGHLFRVTIKRKDGYSESWYVNAI